MVYYIYLICLLQVVLRDIPVKLPLALGATFLSSDQISFQNRSRPYNQHVSQSIDTATGEKAPTQGKHEIHLRIGSLHPMRIADIQDESINSEVELLELHGCMVDLRECTCRIKWEKIPLQKADGYSTVQSKMCMSWSWTLQSSYLHIRRVWHLPRWMGCSLVE